MHSLVGEGPSYHTLKQDIPRDFPRRPRLLTLGLALCSVGGCEDDIKAVSAHRIIMLSTGI